MLATTFFSCVLGFAISDVAIEKNDKRPEVIQAPIIYEDLMLIIADKKGNVAAVMFIKQVQNGVHYKFRFLGRGSKKEVQGKGVVGGIGEKIRRGDKDVFVLHKNAFTIKAGSIEVDWGHRTPGGAWISYLPETMSLQIAASDKFSEIDLRRFALKR